MPVEADVGTLVNANNQFAFDLYHRMSGADGNLFLSPYSISTALAMTSAGARGATLEEMQKVFHFPAQGELHPAVAALRHEINGAAGERKYQLSTANALWGAKDFTFRPEFLKLVKDDYGAELTNLDFAGDSEGARLTINGWVEKETHDKIKELIARGLLGRDTALVLTNAIYFKGMWEQSFQKELTRDEPFRTAGGEKPSVPLMHQTARFGYAETDDFQALQMPYDGKELALLVLLPKTDDLGALEKQLSAGLVSGIVGKLAHDKVLVYLPRFKTSAGLELSDTLKAMGMPLAFSGEADFSGMTVSRRESLMISNVIHKAFVDVNEEGTEAAAATAVLMTRAAAIFRPKPVPVFRADHPFVYLIRDVRNGSVLFLGRLADPTR
jgi:serpin B